MTDEKIMRIEHLPALVEADPVLVRRGRFVDTTFLIEIGETAFLVEVQGGRIASVRRGPFVMPSWTFALRAPAEAWASFFQPLPPPGFNDLFAMLKRRVLKIEGDLHVFMANLLYFKGVLATLCSPEAAR
ncbi:hypothetical protein [Aquabacter sediminis]|uniref:hypothetical protein n=1 Tax=Aquabacter sediminis TaxID=3029197 RepID=UPI00237DEE3F|nr:hypothetical protein [Aquabacter sp. P-9]MDE1568327.1 hypothetical protein [Aquabacter sp. P-9]